MGQKSLGPQDHPEVEIVGWSIRWRTFSVTWTMILHSSVFAKDFKRFCAP
jgi:hypothetical protein